MSRSIPYKNSFAISNSATRGKKRSLPPTHHYDGQSSSHKKRSSDSIWTEEVEKRFEEALEIIPKAGLKKNKVCDVCLGRNQYISIYIKEHTGKERTAKQISSHIQTIYCANKDKKLINLIQNGAPDTPETHKKFNCIFSAILKKKKASCLSQNSQQLQPVPQINASKHPSDTLATAPMGSNGFIGPAPAHIKTLLFSEPDKLQTNLTNVVLDQYTLDRFPNALFNLNHVRSAISMSFNVNIETLSNVPVPLIYKCSNIYLPSFVDNQKPEVDCGDTIRVILENAQEYKLAILTMVYCNKVKITEDFELINTSQFDLDFGVRFWGTILKKKYNDYITMGKVPNWDLEVEAITLEQYIVTVSDPKPDNSVNIERIQSMILSEYVYVNDETYSNTSLENCVGFEFIADNSSVEGNLDISQDQLLNPTPRESPIREQVFTDREEIELFTDTQHEEYLLGNRQSNGNSEYSTLDDVNGSLSGEYLLDCSPMSINSPLPQTTTFFYKGANPCYNNTQFIQQDQIHGDALNAFY